MAAYTLGNAPCLQCNSLFRKHLGPIPALLATTLPPTNANDSLDNIPLLQDQIRVSLIILSCLQLEILYANMAHIQATKFLHTMFILV